MAPSVTGSVSMPSDAVVKYYLYKATESVEFYRPVMYLYLAQYMGYTGIVVLEAIYNLTTVFGEVPTGYVGDRVGRRNSLVIGTTLIAVTLVGLGLARSFPAFAVLYFLWSLGYNFRSGSEDAWLYDTLTDELSEGEFARVRGRGRSVALAVGVVAALVGGTLGAIDVSLPWFVAAATTALGLPVLLSVEESDTYEAADTDELGIRETVGIVRTAVTQRSIRSFVLYYYVLFSAVTYLVFIFLQPVFETVVTSSFAVTTDQVKTLLGAFYAAYNLLGAVLSYYTGAIEEYVGIQQWFLVIPFLVGGALVGMYFVPLLALPTLLLTRGVADTTRSLASQYVNDRIDSLGRATVLSAMAMVSGLTVVPFQIGSGVVSDLTTPLTALALAGGVLLVGSVAVLAWEVPVESGSPDPDGS